MAFLKENNFKNLKIVLILKVMEFWGLIFTFIEVGGKKTVDGIFALFPLSLIGLRFSLNFTITGI